MRDLITCISFSEDAFFDLVREASHAPQRSPPLPQAIYLAEHLKRLGAQCLILERHYVDRHFIEEFTAYYARCLYPPPNHCMRMHIFNIPIDEPRLDQLQHDAARGNFDQVSCTLQAGYRGYILLRPRPSAPFGRTVLAPPPDDASRRLLPMYEHHIHLLGFTLCVRGFDFQQQDPALAACASTATWTALQQLCRRDRSRAPTISAITQAGVGYSLRGRTFPAPGLTIEQICDVLRHFEFSPDVFLLAKDPGLFMLLLHIYLRSGIPVILALHGEEEVAHTVTAVGYRTAPQRWTQALRVPGHKDAFAVTLRNLALDRLYIHDDRIGPYVEACLLGAPQSTGLILRVKGATGCENQLRVNLAVAPLYTRLRCNAAELYERACSLLPLVSQAVPSGDLGVELFFERSCRYLRALYGLADQQGIDPRRVAGFTRQAVLGRTVGVVRWYLGKDAVLDALWDTSDIPRDEHEHLRGLIALRPELAAPVDTLASQLGVVTGHRAATLPIERSLS